MYTTFISFEFFHLSNLSSQSRCIFTDCSDFDRFCLLFRIAVFAMLNEFLCSINFQKLCAMSRSVKNDCVISEYVNFWLCTNPLTSLLEVCVKEVFKGQEKRMIYYDQEE